MNYLRHYNLLIERARNRVLEGYSEKHHIIPRCIGGADSADNIVVLTAEEHYVAHQLLVKLYPEQPKLAYAARMMSIFSDKHRRRGNKLYGWVKRHYCLMLSESMKGRKLSAETKRKISAGNRAKIISTETRKKLSIANKGRKAWNKGKGYLMPCGEDHHMYGKTHSTKARQKISEALTGRKHSEATKRKMSESAKGRVVSEETREKMRKAKENYVPWNAGLSGKGICKATKGSFKKGNRPWNQGKAAYTKSIEIDGVVYKSRKEAAEQTGKDMTTIIRWLKNGKAIDRGIA